METTALNAATTSATSTPAASANSEKLISSDFETFLKMMTTQLQNQDPLNPIENSDFAVQLATFSNVEQQVQTNQLLEALATNLGGSGISDLANFVGMEARVLAPAYYSGAPIEMTLDVSAGADSGVMVVRDAAGDEVQRLPIDTTAPFHVWQGVDDSGAPLPAGNYTFQVESYAGESLINTAQAPVYTVVEEARLEDGQTMLLLASGEIVPSTSVTALRFPVVYATNEDPDAASSGGGA